MTDLTPAERKTLTHHEAVIEKGQQTFVAVGNALAAIKEGKLYRATHKTFSEYCEARWGFGRNYANKLISSAAVVTEMGTNVPIPESEGVAREVARVPAEKRGEVWEKAVSQSGGKPTARDVRNAALGPCPTCGETSVNDDGDCSVCHEPRVESRDFDEAVDAAEHTDVAEGLYLAIKAVWEEDYADTSAAVMAAFLENIAQRIREEG